MMFKRIALVAASLFVLSTPLAGQESTAAIKANCKVEWGTNYRMIAYCIDQQTTAMNNVAALLKKYPKGSEEYNIINRCAAEWPGATGGLNFRMTEYCSENQMKAYWALQ